MKNHLIKKERKKKTFIVKKGFTINGHMYYNTKWSNCIIICIVMYNNIIQNHFLLYFIMIYYVLVIVFIKILYITFSTLNIFTLIL